MSGMQVIVATGNKDKYDEIAKTLSEFGIKARKADISVDEVGSNLEEIVVDKAKKAFSQLKTPLIVDDTGVFFEAYDDFPGAFPNRCWAQNDVGRCLRLHVPRQ